MEQVNESLKLIAMAISKINKFRAEYGHHDTEEDLRNAIIFLEDAIDKLVIK